MNLSNIDFIIINSSGGKDSLVSIYEICRMADEQQFDRSKIVISHQELANEEWPGTKDIVQRQADLFGLKCYYSRRRNEDGYEETLLEYVERRGKWPSRDQRYCTSDFKRAPGARVVTMLKSGFDACNILYVFGFRADESPSRRKKEKFSVNTKLTTKARKVFEYLPVHDWTKEQVWQCIRENNLPYHPAYDLGMPRLSCCFCIFSPFDALVIAGRANPELLKKYVEVEDRIGHDFRNGFKIKSVQEAIEKGYEVDKISDWVM